MAEMNQDTFTVAGREFHSRLLVGTGKYRDMEETRLAIEASGAEIVTIAVRRTNIGQNSDEPNILEVLPPDKYTILPNTAGCYDAATAIRTCRLARELLDGHNLVKLEVLGDEKTLFPDVMATLEAAETLVKDGFDVMVYTNDDPIMARQLEETGCVAVMPLAFSPSSVKSSSPAILLIAKSHAGIDSSLLSKRRRPCSAYLSTFLRSGTVKSSARRLSPVPRRLCANWPKRSRRRPKWPGTNRKRTRKSRPASSRGRSRN